MEVYKPIIEVATTNPGEQAASAVPPRLWDALDRAADREAQAVRSARYDRQPQVVLRSVALPPTPRPQHRSYRRRDRAGVPKKLRLSGLVFELLLDRTEAAKAEGIICAAAFNHKEAGEAIARYRLSAGTGGVK